MENLKGWNLKDFERTFSFKNMFRTCRVGELQIQEFPFHFLDRFHNQGSRRKTCFEHSNMFETGTTLPPLFESHPHPLSLPRKKFFRERTASALSSSPQIFIPCSVLVPSSIHECLLMDEWLRKRNCINPLTVHNLQCSRTGSSMIEKGYVNVSYANKRHFCALFPLRTHLMRKHKNTNSQKNEQNFFDEYKSELLSS